MKLSGTLAEKGIHAFDGEILVRDGVKVPRLWFVVADREKAHIYRKTPDAIECIAQAHTGHGKSHPDETDTGGAVHHGYDLHTQKRQGGETGFIRKLAEWIGETEKAKVFDKIVLVAGPRTLGDMRTLIGANVKTRLAGEIDKDLLHLPEQDIKDHLKKEATL